MKKQILILSLFLSVSAFAKVSGSLSADKLPVDSWFVPTPKMVNESIPSDEDNYPGKKIHYIDRTYWEGQVGMHLNDVSPDTYNNLHLESNQPFKIHGSRKKHMVRDIVSYENDGDYHVLVVTAVSSKKDHEGKVDEVTYSLRVDRIDEKGVQTQTKITGYLTCYRGWGMNPWVTPWWEWWNEGLTVSNVLNQFGGRFTLH